MLVAKYFKYHPWTESSTFLHPKHLFYLLSFITCPAPFPSPPTPLLHDEGLHFIPKPPALPAVIRVSVLSQDSLSEHLICPSQLALALSLRTRLPLADCFLGQAPISLLPSPLMKNFPKTSFSLATSSLFWFSIYSQPQAMWIPHLLC